MIVKKSSFLGLFCAVLLSCAPSQYINVFENKALSNLSPDQYQARRTRAIAQCRLESLKIPVPAPNCTSTTHCDDDGKCTTSNYCDDWAEIRALAERDEAFGLCMLVAGWRAVKTLNPEWVDYQKSR